MTEEKQYQCKVISALIFEARCVEISEDNWLNLCINLHIDNTSIYCIQYSDDGFTITGRYYSFKYVHSHFMYHRRLYFTDKYPELKKAPKVVLLKDISFSSIIVQYGNRTREGYEFFQNVFDMADFLKVNPSIAKILGYVSREQKHT